MHYLHIVCQVDNSFSIIIQIIRSSRSPLPIFSYIFLLHAEEKIFYINKLFTNKLHTFIRGRGSTERRQRRNSLYRNGKRLFLFGSNPEDNQQIMKNVCDDVRKMLIVIQFQCSHKCGRKGRQIRAVNCVSVRNKERAPRYMCRKVLKPARKRKCNQFKCEST